MARPKSNGSKDSSATIGFEAKLWLTADSRSAAETAEGNRSNNMDAADWSGATKTATGSPKGERGGVHQFYTPSCVVRCLVEMLAPSTALRASAFPSKQSLTAGRERSEGQRPHLRPRVRFGRHVRLLRALRLEAPAASCRWSPSSIGWEKGWG
jgi:hypothetical protein